jgi:DNA-binding NtrC family response regulator
MELPTLKLDELERMAIKQALEKTHGSVAKAARVLGIGRATLYRRLAAQAPEVKDEPAP